MTLPRLVVRWVLILGVAGVVAGTAQAQAPQEEFKPVSGQPGKDVVWVPTPQLVTDKMLDVAKVTPQDFVVDLGSGDGRNIISAAKRGARGRGVEYNPNMVALSRRNAAQEGVGDRALFVEGDMFAADFSDATVLALFLLPDNLNKAARQVSRAQARHPDRGEHLLDRWMGTGRTGTAVGGRVLGLVQGHALHRAGTGRRHVAPRLKGSWRSRSSFRRSPGRWWMAAGSVVDRERQDEGRSNHVRRCRSRIHGPRERQPDRGHRHIRRQDGAVDGDALISRYCFGAPGAAPGSPADEPTNSFLPSVNVMMLPLARLAPSFAW